MNLAEVPVEATFALRHGALGWPVPAMRIDDEHAVHLALTHAGAVIAVVSHAAWPCPDLPGRPARYFWGMAVDAAHRRRGAGRRLLGAIAGGHGRPASPSCGRTHGSPPSGSTWPAVHG